MLDKPKSKNSAHACSLISSRRSRPMLTYHSKHVVPANMKHRIHAYYHEELCHPGIKRTCNSIAQHFYWKSLYEDVEKYVSKCPTCAMLKQRTGPRCGFLPLKDV